ncbi:C6 finger domain transcription factor boa13 [Ciborinia camelliae]|nr:C6 finger domain transcription factor boa13 [Ciborinia camelliae]
MSPSGNHAPNINIQTPTAMAPVASIQIVQDGAAVNHSNNNQNGAPVEDSINIICSPAQCSPKLLTEDNIGKPTLSSIPDNFSTSLTNMDTSYLETPMLGHEFLWDFSSDDGPDVLNSVAPDKTSSSDTMNDSGYGDSEYDFSIHEIPATINSHDDIRSPKRQKSNPMPIPPVPEHLSQKRPRSESSDKQPLPLSQHPHTDMRWRSQSQSYTRPTVSIRHHNSYSGEIHDYPESSASFDADSCFDRGFTFASTTSQMNRNHHNMSRISPNSRDDTASIISQSQHMSSPISSSIIPSEASWRFTSKCFTIISKLQKLLRDPSSLSLDVILATNKSAVSELAQIFDSTRAPSAAQITIPENFFFVHSESQPENGYNMSPPMDFTPLMTYVIALKHIHDLYSQACFMFTQDYHRKRSPSIPSPRTTPSNSNSPSCSTSFGLPQLDFGTFKIDVADQRRLFSEIIAKELGNCLGACTRIRSCFLMQPGDISAPTGLLEETFLGIEEGLQRMMKQIRFDL